MTFHPHEPEPYVPFYVSVCNPDGSFFGCGFVWARCYSQACYRTHSLVGDDMDARPVEVLLGTVVPDDVMGKIVYGKAAMKALFERMGKLNPHQSWAAMSAYTGEAL